MDWGLLIISELLCSPPIFNEFRGAQSLVFCVVDHCLSIFIFPIGHCVVTMLVVIGIDCIQM